ncbi:copper homeostasis protein CutC [Gilvimarinus algae]|uniref:PF03932 family protein CutC n=1 Tax=Gilvimarinus algae TaxID=3058037 RepID=A0ABT8TCL2_9GAMM|nr:copper homeostasis protein CutC [Gilvimarinus sp. SDUM040014]MDO3381113.1 copper homeostasis protein CutC [Gilvimarinus sp. SDUM040014]
MPKITFEVCVDTPEGLVRAQRGGADRVELCSALAIGGLTPTRAFMRFAAAQSMPAHVMIRPREGDFCFSAAEVQLMLDEIALAREENMQGVVLGATCEDGSLDQNTLEKLVVAAEGMDLTLHRAFDVTPDPYAALEAAIALGFNRILSSGQQITALAGKALLASLVAEADGRIEIMPGSGINPDNLHTLAEVMPLTSVHASCSSPEQQSPEAVSRLGFSGAQGRRQTNLAMVQRMAKALAEI